MLIIFNSHAAQQKPIKLIYATFFPKTDKQHQLCETWAKEIEKRAHGQLKIDLYSGGNFSTGTRYMKDLFWGAQILGCLHLPMTTDNFPL